MKTRFKKEKLEQSLLTSSEADYKSTEWCRLHNDNWLYQPQTLCTKAIESLVKAQVKIVANLTMEANTQDKLSPSRDLLPIGLEVSDKSFSKK